MNYIIDYSLVSIAYLSVTAICYRLQPKAPSLRNTIFAALLFLGVFFAVMDVLVVVIEPFSYRLPAWTVTLANALFLISVQLSSALFFLYCLVLTGYVKGGFSLRILPALIPFFFTVLLLSLPLGSGGIFYLDGDNIYHRGGLYVVLYIDTALYLAASLTAVTLRRRHLRAKKLFCVCGFLLALFISMVIQYRNPALLLNAMANALALTLIYHVLEAPSTHVDALTGVLNRTALPSVVQDSYEQDRRSTLLIFPLNALAAVNHSLGMAVGDRLLTEFAQYLKGAFPHGYIFRIAGNALAVLETGGEYCGEAAARDILSAMPDSFRVGHAEVRAEAGIACINSEDTADSAEMLSLAAFILQLDREGRLDRVLLTDGAFLARLHAAEDLERRLGEALAAERVEVYYQPLHDRDGALVALEALVRIFDAEGVPLPTQEAVELSERNGSIHRLSALILRRVAAFIRDNRAEGWKLHHIGVNLSALQFIRDDLCAEVSALLDEYGVEHSLVSFEITETATASVTDIVGNMRRMNEAGFSFLLDDFGKGYANFGNLARLPLLCAKIDKLILWEAEESEERMAFLRGVVDMLHTLGLTSVCEGVETAEQAALLKSLGVDMLQGYHFSKPLPPDALLRYIERLGADEL